MALSSERANEIAMSVLQAHLEREGKLKLTPSQMKREVNNFSKMMKISSVEAAEFMKVFFEKAFEKTIVELNKIISGKAEE